MNDIWTITPAGAFCSTCHEQAPYHRRNCPVLAKYPADERAGREAREPVTINPVPFMGFYIGMWLAGLGTSAYAIWWMWAHPYNLNNPWWSFYFWLSLGPVWMLLWRLWKWVFTFAWIACALALGRHEFHKLSRTGELLVGVWAGWQLSKPENQEQINRYGKSYLDWLVNPGFGAVKLDAAQRFLLRVCALFGVCIYCFTAFSVYPEHQAGASYDTPIPEPTPTQRGYSQKDLVVHKSCVGSTQTVVRSNIENSTQNWNWADAPRRDPALDDPNLIQAAYNETVGLAPGSNLLTWVHHHRLYHWSSARNRWTRVKGYFNDVEQP